METKSKTPIYFFLADKLRSMRESAGMSQTEFAQKISAHYKTIQKWEQRKSYPAWDDVCRICEVFGCTPDTFYEQ